MLQIRFLKRVIILSVVVSLSVVALAMQPPQVAFTVEPAAPSTNDLVLLDASTSVGGAAPLVDYEWDFNGDGLVDLSTDQPQVSYFFDESGVFDVSLTVIDASGTGTSLSQSVTVSLAPVSARRTFEMTLMPNRVLAGGSFFVTVTVWINESASGMGLAETLPPDWRARPLDDGGAIFKRAQDALQWLWPQTLNAGQTVTVRYEISVPETASKGTVNLQGTVSSFSPMRFNLPVHSAFSIEVL